MQEFSQSRGDDDLFDDEIIPIEVATTSSDAAALESAPIIPNSRQTSEDPSFRGSRGRGRGSSNRAASKAGLHSSKYAPQAPPEPVPPLETESATGGGEEVTTSTAEDEALSKTTSNTPSTAQPTPSKTLAVRGDRTNTGGVKKPKLTEEELNAKLAAAKERSQNRSAAHARAQADAESFEQRERVASEKRVKDAVNRRVMDNEREKNRARKMAVMGGREWDAEKNEEDFRVSHNGGRGRGGRGGGMGGSRDPGMDDLRQYEWHEDRGRGRGNRGRGGRGGRGARPGHDSRQPDVKAEADFPALPASAKPKDELVIPDTPKTKEEAPKPRPPPMRLESETLSPAEGKGTWADQVESEAANT